MNAYSQELVARSTQAMSVRIQTVDDLHALNERSVHAMRGAIDRLAIGGCVARTLRTDA